MANPKSKKRKKVVIFSLIGLVLIGLGTVAFYRKREVVITVQTENVARRNITEIVVANGKVQPVIQVVINPEVSGEIISLPVKEGQLVKKGDLLVKIKPDNYIASRNSADANFKSCEAGCRLAAANLQKAQLEYERFQHLYDNKLVSDSQFLEAKTTLEVMKATRETAVHQAEQAKAALARADDDLSKTTIYSPLDGTVTKLKSQLGERVVGTAMMAGTEIMTVADFTEMEARVDIGEIDVVLIALKQHAKLEIEAFRDRKFSGIVTEIANSSKGLASTVNGGGGQQQEATKFEVKIHIEEKEIFRPGMSVTAEIETRSRTNVLAVPIQSVTTRLPKSDKKEKKENPKEEADKSEMKNRPGKMKDVEKPAEVVFLLDSERAKMVPVKSGISDDAYIEITSGLTEGQEIVSGGYKAVSRDLEDHKKIKKGAPPEPGKEKK